MKAVILAGGRGTRISEETLLRPKPMVEIGGKPVLWHIMKSYSSWGVNDFVICLGYKGYLIKEFFANYHLHSSDVTIDFRTQTTTIHHSAAEPWSVTLVETGADTMTGGRLARVRRYVDDDHFCFTYGDGVTDLDIGAEIAFHRAQGSLATVLAIRPPGRFGQLTVDDTVWEREPVEQLSREGQLAAYLHRGFWQPMDTLRDKELLEELWSSGHAPWKTWD